mgnify:CR=1
MSKPDLSKAEIEKELYLWYQALKQKYSSDLKDGLIGLALFLILAGLFMLAAGLP